MTVKSSISLSEQQHAFAKGLVEQGRFASVSAVIHSALDEMQRKREAEEADLAMMRAFFKERMEGEFISAEEMKRRLDKMMERKRQEHGVDR